MATLPDLHLSVASVAELSAVSAAGTIVFMALAVQESGRQVETADVPPREAAWNRARNWVLARASLVSITVLLLNAILSFVVLSMQLTSHQLRLMNMIVVSIFATGVFLMARVVAVYLFLEGTLLRIDDSFEKTTESTDERIIRRMWRRLRRNLLGLKRDLLAGKTSAYGKVALGLVVLLSGLVVWVNREISTELSWSLASATLAPVILSSLIALKLEAPVSNLAQEMLSNRLGRRAALAIVARGSGPQRQVLMNRQNEDPYLEEWILLGGYYAEHDGQLQHTANRRVEELTGHQLKVRQRTLLLRTKRKVQVADRMELRRYGLIYVEVHEVENYGGIRFEEYEPDKPRIAWFDIKRLQDEEDRIPPHIFEGARFALTGERSHLRFWDLAAGNRSAN